MNVSTESNLPSSSPDTMQSEQLSEQEPYMQERFDHKTPPARIVTTSWDDGDRADLRIAELLGKRALKGTFYVPLSSEVTSTRLATSDLSELVGNGFEIGGHTFSHQTLSHLSAEEIRREVTTSKAALEQITGRPVSIFSYPNGRYSPHAIAELKNAGYSGART